MISLQEVRIKFIAKVSSLGKDSSGNRRYVVILPKKEAEEGEHMKGKYFWVTLDEIEDKNNEEKKNHRKIK